MLLQLGKIGECSAVDTAELGIFGIALPIGAGAVQELYGFKGGDIQQVGASAQVGEFALAIEVQFPLCAVAAGQLGLVGLALFFPEGKGLLQGEGKGGEGFPLGDDALHLGLDVFQVLGGKGGGYLEIVEETVFGGGTGGEPGFGIEALDSLGQHMGGGVAESSAAFLVFKREECQGAIRSEGGAQVCRAAINAGAAGGSEDRVS